MKVSELIEELKQFQKEDVDEELDVQFGYDYGDHWHNTVTEDITSIEQTAVKYSSYHSKNKVASDEDNEEVTQVILLQAL